MFARKLMFCKILNLRCSKIHLLSQDFQVPPQSFTFSYILARVGYNPFTLRTCITVSSLIPTSEHEFYCGELLCLLGLSDWKGI